MAEERVVDGHDDAVRSVSLRYLLDHEDVRQRIHSDAAIRYSLEPQADEVPFDMPDTEFSPRGNLCNFEVRLRTFSLDEPALGTLAEIVHERDGGVQDRFDQHVQDAVILDLSGHVTRDELFRAIADEAGAPTSSSSTRARSSSKPLSRRCATARETSRSSATPRR